MSSQNLTSSDFARLSNRGNVSGKTVFYRADLNVPMAGGKVTDTTRIERVAEGIAGLARQGARIVVASHLGRPQGKQIPDLSLAPIAPVLGEFIRREVRFIPDSIGENVQSAIKAMADGNVILLENLRFYAGEESGDANFAAQLAESIDLYINDAFSASHRAHASISEIAQLLPSYAGPLMLEELEYLDAVLNTQAKTAAVVGGAKVSTKLATLNNLVQKVDILIIGGGMANTFFCAQGLKIGASLAEPDMAEEARSILTRAESEGCEIILPQDVIVAKELKPGVQHRTVMRDMMERGNIKEDEMILDIGPITISLAGADLQKVKKLIWNGPMGAFETPPFDRGTVELAKHAAKLTKKENLLSVAGGGDTVAALVAAGIEKDFHYVSTAGGAFLEWMEGKSLSGIQALLESQK